MTPLELYQQNRRSGKYHPETEKNWPTKSDISTASEVQEDSKVLDDPYDIPPPKTTTAPGPNYASADRLAHIDFESQANKLNLNLLTIRLDSFFSIQVFWNVVFIFAITALFIGMVILHKERPAPKPQTKTVYRKAPAKKVLVTRTDDKKRREMCYVYGDWNACLAYKKNIPFRARVGRTDL